jgi:hypothetical protein
LDDDARHEIEGGLGRLDFLAAEGVRVGQR